MMNVILLTDAETILDVVDAEEYYLPTGIMRHWIEMAIRRGPGYCKAFWFEGGIFVFTKIPLANNYETWNVSIWISENYRRKGLAKRVVGLSLDVFGRTRGELRFHPWDRRSIGFFSNLVNEGLLTGKNFSDMASGHLLSSELLKDPEAFISQHAELV